MSAPVITSHNSTSIPCDSHTLQGGLAYAPVISSPSDHIVAIAVGVGVPGGLLLITILAFIIVIFLSVQRMKRRRLQFDIPDPDKVVFLAVEEGGKPERDRAHSSFGFDSRPNSVTAASNQRISNPNTYSVRPFVMHTVNRSFSSSIIPPSYHSTEDTAETESPSTIVAPSVKGARSPISPVPQANVAVEPVPPPYL
ncbi:hypothetical protein BC835DRAFT_1417485 [Cytidiella melzeri]|nr:hypothetical protein BC835DRAFT_1417485 [Cytidiella melzeri]